MSNSSKIFSYKKFFSIFIILGQSVLDLSCSQTDLQEHSVVAVMNHNYNKLHMTSIIYMSELKIKFMLYNIIIIILYLECTCLLVLDKPLSYKQTLAKNLQQTFYMLFKTLCSMLGAPCSHMIHILLLHIKLQINTGKI